MDAPQFDAQAKYEMSKSLMEHARYLYQWTPRFLGGNWQVIEATGVATAGIMLPEAKDAAAWRERGLARLAEHMKADILPDGGHSELTPSYHQWVLQQYANTAQLARVNGIDATGLTARHEKMYEWLLSLESARRHRAAHRRHARSARHPRRYGDRRADVYTGPTSSFWALKAARLRGSGFLAPTPLINTTKWQAKNRISLRFCCPTLTT